MVFTNLNIYKKGDYIIIFQDNAECGDNTVYITANMVDCVCAGLKKLKKQIQEGK